MEQHASARPESISPTCDRSRHVPQLEALRDLSGLIGQHASMPSMLQAMLSVMERRLGFRCGTIMVTTVDNQHLVVEAVPEGTPGRDAVYRRGEGITGEVLRSGQPAVIPRLADEPRFQGRIHHRPSREKQSTAFVCVPIMLDGGTIGTLSEDIPHEAMDTAEAERFLRIVAGIIAHGIHQRRLSRLESEALEEENARLRRSLGDRYQPADMVASSREMEDVFARMHIVAPQNTTVLIRGESGTGKELVASALHYNSPRADKPFVKIHCAALSETLLESELFGHEKGAFTGAIYPRRGRLEEANGGTLFLDEIGDFSPTIQLKLLRAIQEREFQRVGSNETIGVDVRIIAATNRDLEDLVAQGRFRQDFYYRVNVFSISLPPLRARRGDVLLLANHFVAKFAASMGKDVRRISTTAIQMLTAYHWPGNVRELENCIEHAVLLSQGGVIHGRDLPPTLQMPGRPGPGTEGSLRSRVESLERDMIVDALKRTHGNVSAASRELGITGRMVRYKIRNLGIALDRLFPRRQPRAAPQGT